MTPPIAYRMDGWECEIDTTHKRIFDQTHLEWDGQRITSRYYSLMFCIFKHTVFFTGRWIKKAFFAWFFFWRRIHSCWFCEEKNLANYWGSKERHLYWCSNFSKCGKSSMSHLFSTPKILFAFLQLFRINMSFTFSLLRIVCSYPI